MGGPTMTLPPPGAVEGQTYCLRWNNHKSNLVEILDALIKVESYVDCTIVVDEQVQFKAHRVVLAANSPYFQSILQDVPMDHCSIIFPGVKAFEMRALLEYMYTGEVNVTQSQIPKIMRIAEELEVKGLFDMADLKEKFNKLSDEHADRAGNPYSASRARSSSPYTDADTSSTLPQNGTGRENHEPSLQSSSVISTSNSAAQQPASTSSSSPPYNSYKSPYTNLYSKQMSSSTSVQTITRPLTPPSHTREKSPHSGISGERTQWPLSPGIPSAAAAAAMLSSVYESAPDMNPLKRKKLSSISSMLMSRDTPILRNVLAQNNPADSSQPLLMLPGNKNEKVTIDKHTTVSISESQSANPNDGFNGSDYSSDKKYTVEPHSPYTDRSFEEESFELKGSFGTSFGGSSNTATQKPEWKRYKQYTRNDIMSAIQCVRDGMSALQASRKFGVPSRTLYDKVKKLGITTGRPMNRTMKRSPSNTESNATYASYAHAYGQTEPLLSSRHEGREDHELGSKEQQQCVEQYMPPTIPHHAAALLDHAFLQQALENRGGDIAGREALHAMALAAAAHAAVNRMSTSPGPNGNARSPSPNFGMKYARSEQELHLEREKGRLSYNSDRKDQPAAEELERQNIELEMEHDEDHVEDLSVARKMCENSPTSTNIPKSAFPPPILAVSSLPTPPRLNDYEDGNEVGTTAGGVIMQPMSIAKFAVMESSDLSVNKRERNCGEGRRKYNIADDKMHAD